MPPATSPTVFVVDDDAAVRKVVSRLLRSAGIAVAAFASPRRSACPGTIQGWRGVAARLISRCLASPLQLQTTLGEKGSSLPIIFLTGHGDVSNSVQAMKHGAFDFFTKPVNAKNLLPAIHAAIIRDAVTRREQAKLSEICARFDTLTPREREVLGNRSSPAS